MTGQLLRTAGCAIVSFLLVGCLSPDRTMYAPGYTDEGYNKVAVGMSRKEVIDLLGEPLKAEKGTYEKRLRYLEKEMPDDSHPVPAARNGAASFAEFAFDGEGRLISQSGQSADEPEFALGTSEEDVRAHLGEPDDVLIEGRKGGPLVKKLRYFDKETLGVSGSVFLGRNDAARFTDFVFDREGRLISRSRELGDELDFAFGTTEEDVRARLGEPDHVLIQDREGELLVYGMQDPAYTRTDYTAVMIHIAPEGRVVWKNRYLVRD